MRPDLPLWVTMFEELVGRRHGVLVVEDRAGEFAAVEVKASASIRNETGGRSLACETKRATHSRAG